MAGWWIIFLLGQNATSKLDLLDRLGDADVPAPSGAWGDNGGASAVGGGAGVVMGIAPTWARGTKRF